MLPGCQSCKVPPRENVRGIDWILSVYDFNLDINNSEAPNSLYRQCLKRQSIYGTTHIEFIFGNNLKILPKINTTYSNTISCDLYNNALVLTQ